MNCIFHSRTFVPISLEKHQKSCTKATPMNRSTKEKNFSARASIEKDETDKKKEIGKNNDKTPLIKVASNKEKYVVKDKYTVKGKHEADKKDEDGKNNDKTHLPKSNQPIYLSIRRSSKVKEETEADIPRSNHPIYLSIRKGKDEADKSDDGTSIDEIVKVIKESKILQDKGNREELLVIIKNFLKFKS